MKNLNEIKKILGQKELSSLETIKTQGGNADDKQKQKRKGDGGGDSPHQV